MPYICSLATSFRLYYPLSSRRFFSKRPLWQVGNAPLFRDLTLDDFMRVRPLCGVIPVFTHSDCSILCWVDVGALSMKQVHKLVLPPEGTNDTPPHALRKAFKFKVRHTAMRAHTSVLIPAAHALCARTPVPSFCSLSCTCPCAVAPIWAFRIVFVACASPYAMIFLGRCELLTDV